MKNYLIILLLLGLGSFSSIAQDDAKSTDEIVTINVKDLKGHEADFVGKEFYLTGIVDHVCKHGGKKAVLASEDGEVDFHVMAGNKISKFDRKIEGDEIKVLVTMTEDHIDEAYVIRWEEEVKKHHKPSDEEYKEDMKRIAKLRKRIEDTKEGYLVNYVIEGVNYEVLK